MQKPQSLEQREIAFPLDIASMQTDMKTMSPENALMYAKTMGLLSPKQYTDLRTSNNVDFLLEAMDFAIDGTYETVQGAIDGLAAERLAAVRATIASVADRMRIPGK